MSDKNETDVKVDDIKTAMAVDKAQEESSDLIELSSGVVLRAKKANPLVMIRVMAAFPRPKPPTWFDPTMGREMENPNDPDYLEKVQAWQMEMSSSMLSAMIMLGTELESKPKGFPGPHPSKSKSNGSEKVEWPAWIEEYALLGIPMHTQNASWRYLTWVMFKAVEDEKDLEKIREVVGRLSGIREESVQTAEQFPGSDKAD